VLLGIVKGKEVPSLVSLEDETKHAQLRRSVANAFTPTSVLEMEKTINPTIALLLEVLEQRKVVDLSGQMLWYSLDNAGRIAFNEDIGCLKADSDMGNTGRMIHARFNHWGRWSSLPGLERLVYRNPVALRLATAQPSSIATGAAFRLRSRLESKELPPEAEQDLLHKFMEASKKNPNILDMQGIIGLVMSTISGAADTTASSLVALIYYLHKNPYALEKLKAELQEANITLPIPDFVETRNLPYLDAVMKEAMRLFSVLNWPMERRVPAGGVVIAGTFFPEGTSVGCLPQAVHRNRAVYGEDVDVFRPERWLEADKEALRKMESLHLGFSRGKRVCLGQHIAVMQLKKVIPAMVMKFKVSNTLIIEQAIKLDS
jgi:cytochrome P450